ncbi:hypothetical protein [Bradyrhizobium sp. USDA 4504]
MYKWEGNLRCASIPKEITEDLQQRTTEVLKRHGLSDRSDIVQALIDEVSWAFAGGEHKLRGSGRGRPVDGPEKLLSVLVANVLSEHGIRGNWLGLGDEQEDGVMGVVAELESVALAALRQARKKDCSTMSRPARVSEARKMLGRVRRNDPPLQSK